MNQRPGEAPEGLLRIGREETPELSGGPQEISIGIWAQLMQPKLPGERLVAMVRLMGHYCALGDTRHTIYGFLSMWNERNTPPLEPDEFEYQFEKMFSRWGAPREEMTLEEQVVNLREHGGDDPIFQRRELRNIIHGLKLPTREYLDWQEVFKEEFGLTKKAYEMLVHRLPDTNGTTETDPQAPVDVEGDRRVVAVELLKDPALLHLVLLDMKRRGLVREEANVLLCYLSATSRLTDDPINIIFLGSASAGKSVVMLTAMLYVPPEQSIVRQRWSGQAIIYSPLSFEHVAICILERTGAEASGYNIRTLQSEKDITVEITSKEESTGKFTTKEYRKKGPTAFLTTTTSPEIDEQDESRVWILHPDETAEQTHLIMMAQEEDPEEGPGDTGSLEPFLDAQRLLNIIPVARPGRLIRVVRTLLERKMPTVPVRMRRDHNRLIAAIKTSALMHQYQRTTNEQGRLVPDFRDYYMVYSIASMAFQQSISGRLDPKVMDCSDIVRQVFVETGETVRIEQIMAAMGLQESATRRWVNRALAAGEIQREDRGRFVPAGAESYLGEFRVLPTPNEVLELDPSLGEGMELVDPITGEEMHNVERK